MSYKLIFPRKIIFGNGQRRKLPENLPKKARILLVAGNHAEKSGLVSSLQIILKGFEIVTACGIQAEPPLSEVNKLIKAGRYNAVDAVVAVGGGSVIDAAKTAAALIPLQGGVREYFYGEREIAGRGLFFAALPTTSGTGAEITPNAVLTDPDTMIKKSIKHPEMIPNLAIVDPELTWSCPASLTAASGLDAFTQAVESYISRSANHTTKALAAKSAALLFDALPRVCRDLNDKSARESMAEGSIIGAMAFTQSGLGAVHGIGHPIGSKLRVPHGICCAILLPAILRLNLSECGNALAELAAACGCVNAKNFVDAIEKLCSKLDIPENFRPYGLNQSHYPFIVKNCRSGSMKNNPRHLTDEDVINLLENLT